MHHVEQLSYRPAKDRQGRGVSRLGLRACARCDPRDPWEREREREREREGERARASGGERGREGERGGERGRERECARERGGERARERGRDMGSRSIANKYHAGTVKRTLKRKVKVLEVAENEVSEATMSW